MPAIAALALGRVELGEPANNQRGRNHAAPGSELLLPSGEAIKQAIEVGNQQLGLTWLIDVLFAAQVIVVLHPVADYRRIRNETTLASHLGWDDTLHEDVAPRRHGIECGSKLRAIAIGQRGRKTPTGEVTRRGDATSFAEMHWLADAVKRFHRDPRSVERVIEAESTRGISTIKTTHPDQWMATRLIGAIKRIGDPRCVIIRHQVVILKPGDEVGFGRQHASFPVGPGI